MTAVCPSCSKPFVFADERFGDRPSVRVRCPACGGVVTLEKQNPEPAPPPAARASGTARAPAPQPVQLIPAGEAAAVAALVPDSEGPPTVKVKKSATLEGVAPVDHVPPMPRDRRISLALLSGPDTGKVLLCSTSRAVIGRAGTDIPIQDDEISRRHALIEIRDDRYFLKDLGSTNGTFVDERRITETEIFDKSEFRVGNTHCMLIVTAVDDL